MPIRYLHLLVGCIINAVLSVAIHVPLPKRNLWGMRREVCGTRTEEVYDKRRGRVHIIGRMHAVGPIAYCILWAG